MLSNSLKTRPFKWPSRESIPKCSSYENTNRFSLTRFFHFIACAFAAVLAVAALVDPELITSFEITPGGTIVFWIGILGTVIAMARGMIPEEKLVYDPEEAIKYVVNYTHYLPADWNGKLHSDHVSDIVSTLKSLKLIL